MLSFAFALTFHLSAAGGAADPWFATDKLKHFFMSAFVESVSYGGLRTLGIGQRPALVGASGVTLAVGAGKELWDRQGHGDPSLRDFTWDVAGGVVGAALMSRTIR